MIKFIREYRTTYKDGRVSETKYDVIHETNDKTRWYFYTEDDLPKTARRFISTANKVIPYNDYGYNEHGVTYWMS
jgi:hypothetical protein